MEERWRMKVKQVGFGWSCVWFRPEYKDVLTHRCFIIKNTSITHVYDGVMPLLIPWQEEAQPRPEELATPVEHSSSRSSLTVSRPGSRNFSLDVDSVSESSSGRGRRSFIGLSDKELLKCAFSYPQTEGATESPDIPGEHLYTFTQVKSSTLKNDHVY